jgi:hypothetical protein
MALRGPRSDPALRSRDPRVQPSVLSRPAGQRVRGCQSRATAPLPGEGRALRHPVGGEGASGRGADPGAPRNAGAAAARAGRGRIGARRSRRDLPGGDRHDAPRPPADGGQDGCGPAVAIDGRPDHADGELGLCGGVAEVGEGVVEARAPRVGEVRRCLRPEGRRRPSAGARGGADADAASDGPSHGAGDRPPRPVPEALVGRRVG